MKGNRRSFRYSFLFGDICGAYAIRPYPDGRMDARGSIGNPIFLTKGCRRSFRYSFLFGDICGAYAIRPYPDGRMDARGSIGNPIFLTKGCRRSFRYSFLFGDICGAYAIRPYSDGRMDARGLIDDPVPPAKAFRRIDRQSHSISDHLLIVIHHGKISLRMYHRAMHDLHSRRAQRDRTMDGQVASPRGTAHACSSYTRSRRR